MIIVTVIIIVSKHIYESEWFDLKLQHGVVLPFLKSTSRASAYDMPVAKHLTIPMLMHRGKPAKCLVSVGDLVKVGQRIGDAVGLDSAHIHSSVSGIVSEIQDTDPVTGKARAAVVIESDGKQELDPTLTPPTVETTEQFLDAIRASGVVGLGGAGWPTAPKLTITDDMSIDYIILNGAECEPYMTCDTRTMVEDRELLWHGIRALHRFLGVENIVIAIDRRNVKSVESMREYVKSEPIARVEALDPKYPQGAKLNLVHNVTGRTVPEAKATEDVGCIILNVTTLASVMRYIETGIPMIKKRVTVDGSAVTSPRNVLVPLGTPLKDVFEFCGGLRGTPAKVITGGPMMGSAAPDMSMPVTKSTNTLLAFFDEDTIEPTQSACIRCGRCVSGCPMNLSPPAIQAELERAVTERLYDLKIRSCVECGCCSFTCPAGIPLAQNFRAAKTQLRNAAAKKEG